MVSNPQESASYTPKEPEVQHRMNNSTKSVANKARKSKAVDSKKSTKSKRTMPHATIPLEDLAWISQQKPTVFKLWSECWQADRFGSRWMSLKTSLKYSSFMAAKKVLSDSGLFVFQTRSSIRDARETEWYVLNLHGVRKKDFWYGSENSDKKHPKKSEPNSENFDEKHPEKSEPNFEKSEPNSENSEPNSENSEPIDPKTQSQQGLQNPSITPHKHLNNSSKELLEVFNGEEKKKEIEFANRSQRSFGGKIPPNPQNGGCLPPNPQGAEGKGNDLPAQSDLPEISDKATSPELTKKSTEEALKQEYIPNPQSQEAVVRAAAQNLAIEAQKTTKEYQTTSKEAFARIRAIFDEKKKQKQAEREANLRGDSPMNFSERQAFEQYKREVETNRKKQAEEKLVDFWDF